MTLEVWAASVRQAVGGGWGAAGRWAGVPKSWTWVVKEDGDGASAERLVSCAEWTLGRLKGSRTLYKGWRQRGENKNGGCDALAPRGYGKTSGL